MKVLHVINALSSGGAEKLLTELAINMCSEQIQIEVLVLSSRGDVYSSKLQREGIQVFTLSNGSVYNICLLFSLCRFFSKHQYDIIHVHLFPSLYYVSLLKKLHFIKGKLIFHEHNTINGRNKYKFFIPIEKYIYSSYNKIICISDAVKEKLHNYLSLPSEKLKLIYNGINIKECQKALPFNIADLKLPIEDNDTLLVMAARLSEQKDHATLFRAMHRLPANYKLLLLGEGNKKEELMSLAQDLDLKNNIFFLGYNTQIYSIVKACNIFILSSNWEGFGLVCVEAMACGCPVIASDVAGLKDVVSNAGLLFPPHDAITLANKIQQLATNPELQQQLISKGYTRSKDFSIEKTTHLIYTLYLNLLKDE